MYFSRRLSAAPANAAATSPAAYDRRGALAVLVTAAANVKIAIVLFMWPFSEIDLVSHSFAIVYHNSGPCRTMQNIFCHRREQEEACPQDVF